jgi:hypothetical protein
MSKRKKTPTSKNTQPKLTKVQLTKKVSALDLVQIEKLAGQTGIIGAAFRINYHEVDGTYNREEAMCSKCIQPMERLIAESQRFGFKTQEDRDELGNAIASLTHQIYNEELPESMVGYDLTRQADVLFNMLMAFVLLTDEVKDYFDKNKDGRVGMLVTYSIRYDVQIDEFSTKLAIKSRDNFEEWITDSTELVASGKGTILTK